ncbi:MAG: 50S ribosomal protein L4 [Capsulimonadales bacterium]|nr:50S ribosomal protein L4 [Capsulimonadales bacterium]
MAIKTKGGGTAGEIALSDRVFGAKRNIPLMWQAVRTELENWRQDTRNAPGRGEMLGGGKKPFRQKGTGRSRQGSMVAPHWRKGGAAHGPHPRDLSMSLPKKMRWAALRSALSAKLADNELVIVDALPTIESPSTKAMAAFLNEIVPTAKKSLVVVEEHNETLWLSLRNLPNVTVRVAPAFSTRDVIDGGIIVMTRAAAEKVDAQWNDGKGTAGAAENIEAGETAETEEGGAE